MAPGRRRVPLWDQPQVSPTVSPPRLGRLRKVRPKRPGLSARCWDEVLTLPSGFSFGARLGWLFLLWLCCVFASHVHSLPPVKIQTARLLRRTWTYLLLESCLQWARGQEGSAGLPFQRSGADDALEQGPDSGFEQLDSLGQDEPPLCAQCQGSVCLECACI